MRKSPILFVFASLFLFAVGCASSGGDDDNNNNVNNVNNINNVTGACSTYCPASKVCVGSSDEHSTCVDPCPCSNDKICYQNGCVDLRTDENNCGSGGNYCSGECINGQCTDACAANGTPCQNGESCCQDNGIYICRNLTSDMYNCGSCGNTCDSVGANACVAGQCACGTTAACTSGRACCSNACQDLNTSVYNCGTCGNVCGTGLTCSAGDCMCGSVACNTGESCCGTYCANTSTDPTNCGECGHNCGTGNGCVGGECTCGSSGTVCRGTFTETVDFSSPCFDLGMGLTSCFEECCDGECTITQVNNMLTGGEADPENCDQCGISCGGNSCCCSQLGGCTCCNSGQTCTSGMCSTGKM
ncbi:hypothetical protein KKF84_04315 [Myxococcota bacterium]|nr:hypothetical protein [Myxococcota bacterium]